ncbi:hypothetical protein ALMP_72150 [Streptomyces sp. A012304]|nr:hypothetical protein ALMP_72150 [Streptomyces sp. A012304]
MTSTAPTSTTAPIPDLARPQPRILRVLVASQVLSGAGLAAGVTVGALLAQDVLGSTSLAGLPRAPFTTGSVLAAAVGRISQARGRRPGLATGYLTGAIGSAGVIIAAVLDNPVLLFIALFAYGAGTATNLQPRYAGADLAAPGHRARAVSTVLVATTSVVSPAPTSRQPSGVCPPGSCPSMVRALIQAGQRRRDGRCITLCHAAGWRRQQPRAPRRAVLDRLRPGGASSLTPAEGLMPGVTPFAPPMAADTGYL